MGALVFTTVAVFGAAKLADKMGTAGKVLSFFLGLLGSVMVLAIAGMFLIGSIF